MARAVTSANALSELRIDLSQLSKTLHEVYDLMTADMTNIGQEWQDGQYEQFRDAYSKQIHKCEYISVQYNRWCTSVLDTTIANVEAVERTDVVSGGNTISGGTTAAAAATSAVGIGSRFNMNSKNSVSPIASPSVMSKSSSGEKSELPYKEYTKWEKATGTGYGLSKADKACIDEHNTDFHAVPAGMVDKYPEKGYKIKQESGTNDYSFSLSPGVSAKAPAAVTAAATGVPIELQGKLEGKVDFNHKGKRVEGEIGCMSEETMKELHEKYGESFK